MQIPIVSGIYTDENSDFRTSYPRNMIPVPKKQGLSNGYLRPADGIVALGTGPGTDRGAINWNGTCYRVMGTSLVSVASDGTVTNLGFVGGSGQVKFDYSFDYLAIATGGKLYLWNGTLTQITDPDLGTVVDFIWIDGYFMTTDGEFLVVTDLDDPFSVNPLKYGSSEVDPDPVKALLKLKDEAYALNRYTIEVFDNIGGSLFPFQRIEGAQIERGTIGTHSCCVFVDGIAFVGGGRNESPAVWLGAGGSTIKLSTREIDQILAGYSEETLTDVLVEPHTDKGHRQIYIHLPDQTLVYDAAASATISTPVWFRLTTSVGQYRAKNIIWCYDKWVVGDPGSFSIGTLTDEISSHWGVENDWEFSTMILYNESNGAIFHELELVCLTGRGVDSTIWTMYSLDGETFSMPKPASTGAQGNRNKRIIWLRQGTMRQWRVQSFRGTSDAHISVARLEARIESMVH
ncbi:hypothetical protein KAR91_21315 [Candidatus Pacearchaeota archaeon]|nr:hypothetical protein [Candidatus Pacearchaeota archaeon]